MRQVPGYDAVPIGIVGSGRVARHFQHYFDLLGLPACAWSRRAPSPSPPETFSSCRTVMILIRDAEIVPFIKAWPTLKKKHLVHCSGSLVTPLAEAAHPLMTFSADLYGSAEYRAIPFVLDAGGTPFKELLPGVPNPSFMVKAIDRPYYHALCVMAGNFSTILWLKLFDELERRFGIPPSAAHPYLRRTSDNVIASGNRALTGPLSRGDAEAIAANLKALEDDSFHDIYTAFVRAYENRT